jgi:hypothetical protein
MLNRIIFYALFLFSWTAVQADSWTEGPKTLLILNCSYQDEAAAPRDQSDVVALMFSTGGVDDGLRMNTYGRAWFTSAEVVNVTLPNNRDYYEDMNRHALARTHALEAAGLVGDDYDRVCTIAAGIINSTGLAWVNHRYLWFNGWPSKANMLHELGHNWGLRHANRWDWPGHGNNDPMPADWRPRDVRGENVEYGDGSDNMGGGQGILLWNAWQKRRIDVLKEANGEIAVASGPSLSQVYRIYDHSNPDLSESGTEMRLLEVEFADGLNRRIWISHTHENAPVDSMRLGVQVHASGISGDIQSLRLDMTPGSSVDAVEDIRDGQLLPGRTYTDTAWDANETTYHFGRVSVTPLGTGTSPGGVSYADVQVVIEGENDNTPPDSVTLSGPTSLNVGESGSFSVSASDPDGDSFAYVWDFDDGSVSVDNTDTIQHSWGTAGLYRLGVTVGDRRGGEIVAEQWVNVGSQPYRSPENPAATLSGLEYRYFEGNFPAIPDFDTLMPASSGSIDRVRIPDEARSDGFAVEYRGYLTVAESDVYTFYLNSDDGSRLYIGDTLVVNNSGLKTIAGEASGNIALSAGTHAVRVEFFHSSGSETVQLDWDRPGQARAEVGAGLMSREDPASYTAPTVSVTQPSDGDSVTVGQSVTFAANAADADGIDRVLFFLDGNLLATDTTAPYEVNWTASSVKSFSVRALAFDSTDRWTLSDAVTFSVDSEPRNQVAINFEGTTSYAPDGAGYALSATDEAGAIYPTANWVNFNKATDGTQANFPFDGPKTYTNLSDGAGAATTLDITWAGSTRDPDAFNLADTGTANGTMMKGYSYINDSGMPMYLEARRFHTLCMMYLCISISTRMDLRTTTR